jgi:DNA-binding transcriptional regulator PaaX
MSASPLRECTRRKGSAEMETVARTAKEARKKRRVSLNTSVSIFPIPMRTEYSEKVRERLWSSAVELYTNAARNSIEFASEGWNWRTVTEDEQMILCHKSGELIHPVHIHNLLAGHGLQSVVGFLPNRDREDIAL